ncbi:hypothetical protein MTR67_045106 [Solanum verrucosum]|uniref:Uncharacterized protein n=1 Tax=Solanum verrucosum TaxID=315347 RepID=A0AAF0ZU95_SOLVR|nr:hypothetical protein MTR67_045106 [Solanum verrucosum]
MSSNVNYWSNHCLFNQYMDVFILKVSFWIWKSYNWNLRACLVHRARGKALARPSWSHWFPLFHNRVSFFTNFGLYKQRIFVANSLSLDFFTYNFICIL